MPGHHEGNGAAGRGFLGIGLGVRMRTHGLSCGNPGSAGIVTAGGTPPPDLHAVTTLVTPGLHYHPLACNRTGPFCGMQAGCHPPREKR
jgi:hypothetical protein